MTSSEKRPAADSAAGRGSLCLRLPSGKADRLAFVIILASYCLVLFTGLAGSSPLVGDEVTHFYLLESQKAVFPGYTFDAEIPLGTGEGLSRHYPHVVMWHYLGAALSLLFGGGFGFVQFYHSLYWLQFLVVGWFLARGLLKDSEWGPVLYLLTLASLPMGILFSTVFYLDVPVVAQVMLSLLFLHRRRLFPSLLFFVFALLMKETVLVLLPFYVLLAGLAFRDRGTAAVAARSGLAAVALLATLLATAVAFESRNVDFYPYRHARQYVQKLGFENLRAVEWWREAAPPAGQPSPSGARVKRSNMPEIAYHPGDLRMPRNWLIYGGGVLWFVVAAGLVMLLLSGRGRDRRPWLSAETLALFGLGLWHAAVTGFHMRHAPDARFFLPALPLLLLLPAAAAARLPRRRLWLPLVILLAVTQSGAVAAKAWSLRHVRPGIQETIAFLKANPVKPNTLFMYPEGHYRLFPADHNWYLSHRLRKFWKASNDDRIAILQHYGIGAVVIKKYLVGTIDPEMNNLGIYPDFFLRQIAGDERFRKVFENGDVIIYLVPQEVRIPLAEEFT